MKALLQRLGQADRSLLPEGRLAGPMPWVVAIMMFLTLLAAAAGIGLAGAARSLGSDIADRITVQIVEANPDLRDAQARLAERELGRLTGVKTVRRIPQAETARMLEPWLGQSGLPDDLPVPAMIDVTVESGREMSDTIRTALTPIAPSARIDANSAFLAPLGGLIGALRLLALGLVLLMIGASAATVVLTARASLGTHRSTIEVMHLMGATDVQIARLFQRRIAIDALLGGIVGFLAAALVIVLIGARVRAIGSELLGSVAVPGGGWLILLLIPLAGTALAMLVARVTILRALGRML